MEKLRRIVHQIAYTPKSQSPSTLSPLHLSLIPLLFLSSSLYKIIISFRHTLHQFGFIREHRLPVPVISIGNLTWGGNGKTPMVEFIANWLANDVGISPLILTRHLSMSRDLEIVMVNALSPWGNHHLLPYGPLREPLASFTRADAAVIHHADMVPYESLSLIESKILNVNRFLPIYLSAMTPSHFFKAPNSICQLHVGVIFGKTVLCVSAIGSPNSFVQKIEKMGPLYIDRMDYSDHHQFQEKDIKMIKARLEELNIKFGSKPTIIVTEKDYDRDSKILGGLDPFEVLVLCCKLQILNHNGCSKDSFKKLLTRSLKYVTIYQET
ncbi:hypothetical protein R6Q59_022417 [Mikania micrantha]